ncbi:MAG: SAM-dependent methyltransferase [Bacteriovorax sp.]|nr:SAM-dependent methyltransferase [Bacteriovorax sp.]
MWPAKKFMESSSGREVFCADALVWLESQSKESLAGSSLVASMPDISEFTNFSLAQWKEWFTNTAALIMSRTPDDGVVVFYQSDIKYEGEWVDKAYLVQKAAEQEGLALLWHKIVCRVDPGVATFGKPAYSHIICFSKNIRLHDMSRSTTDVIPELGEKTWVRGMGLENCLMIANFIATQTKSTTVVQPFCGEGSLLAAAAKKGLHGIGIERSPKRAEKARHLIISDDLKSWIE